MVLRDVPCRQFILSGVWCDGGVVFCYHCSVDADSMLFLVVFFVCLGFCCDVGVMVCGRCMLL